MNRYYRPRRRPKGEKSPVVLEFESFEPIDFGDHKRLFSVHYSESPREGWVKCSTLRLRLGTLRRVVAEEVWVDPSSLGNISRVAGADRDTVSGSGCDTFYRRRPIPVVIADFADPNDYERAMTAMDPHWREREAKLRG